MFSTIGKELWSELENQWHLSKRLRCFTAHESIRMCIMRSIEEEFKSMTRPSVVPLVNQPVVTTVVQDDQEPCVVGET
jgi:hypothetical protein